MGNEISKEQRMLEVEDQDCRGQKTGRSVIEEK
jgi:hypothetical protein